MKKIRRSMDFTEPQMKFLKAEAKRLGISVPDVVRRLIDSARGA